jgi:hypothetical protein
LLAKRLNITATVSNRRVLASAGFAIGRDGLPVVRGHQDVEFLTAACCQAESGLFLRSLCCQMRPAGQKRKTAFKKRLFEGDAFSLLTAHVNGCPLYFT